MKSVDAMNRNLVALTQAVGPHVGIVDGFVGMHREGPRHGTPIKLGVVIAGTDPVAVDAVSAAIMGFDPRSIGYLAYAEAAGLGTADLDAIRVVGDPIAAVRRRCVPHSNHGIQGQWPYLAALTNPPTGRPHLIPSPARRAARPRMTVSVILAAIDALATVHSSVARFREELDGRGEIVLVDASRDGTAHEVARVFPDVRTLRRPPGLLAPELWAEGIRATDSTFVALSTAQMAPRPGWLSGLLGGIGDHAAAGGPIAPGPGLSSTGRAMYLLRYANYLPPLAPAGVIVPPGDNSLYRRDRLRDGWDRGFWEVEVHRRLRERGERTTMVPGAIVEFLGGVSLPSGLSQRFAHAGHYGASRSRRVGIPRRVARTAAAPLVPALLAARIARNLSRRGLPIAPWLAASPRLALLATAWSLGEQRGAWFGAPVPRR